MTLELPINVKRTYRVYREEGLMVRKRRRKKLPVPERQPLFRPAKPNVKLVIEPAFRGWQTREARRMLTCSRGN